MNNQTMPPTPHAERVDADAVCARCGTVNPEDTLICKTCGNNLRDQRAARMAMEQPQEVAAAPGQQRGVIQGILALVGLLLILWVALNSDRIAQGMVSGLTSQNAFTLGLWSGQDGARLDDLAASLETAPPSANAQLEAIRSPVNIADPAGMYVLARESEAEGIRPVGTAIVQRDEEDDTLYFVGHTDLLEVRGRGRVNTEGMLVVDWAGYREGAREYEVRGAALPMAAGGLECYGEPVSTDEEAGAGGYNFFAYKVLNGNSQP